MESLLAFSHLENWLFISLFYKSIKGVFYEKHKNKSREFCDSKTQSY
jgi:hypothetical protein